MTYVDAAIWPYRNMVMCHLLADTEKELHIIASKIGIRRKWFQSERYPHYDICKTKRTLAIKHGAKEISALEFVKLARSQIKI